MRRPVGDDSTLDARRSNRNRYLGVRVLLGVGFGLVVLSSSGCSVNAERIVKVASTPDTPDFQQRVAEPYRPGSRDMHVDIGYVWTQDSLFDCPVVNSGGKYVGYIESGGSYLPLSTEELGAMTKRANITLESSPALPFWDAWGGKLALLAFPSLLGLAMFIDSRLSPARRGDREPSSEETAELGPSIGAYVKPSRPTVRILVGYLLPAALGVITIVMAIGLISKHDLALGVLVGVGLLIPVGLLFLYGYVWTRGQSVRLYEGGLIQTVGSTSIVLKYEDLLFVAVGGLRHFVSGIPVARSYHLRFTPKTERDFSLELTSRDALERLLNALHAKGVRIEPGSG